MLSSEIESQQVNSKTNRSEPSPEMMYSRSMKGGASLMEPINHEFMGLRRLLSAENLSVQSQSWLNQVGILRPFWALETSRQRVSALGEYQIQCASENKVLGPKRVAEAATPAVLYRHEWNGAKNQTALASFSFLCTKRALEDERECAARARSTGCISIDISLCARNKNGAAPREQIEIFYLQSACDFYEAAISLWHRETPLKSSKKPLALSLFPISESVYVIFALPATFLFLLVMFSRRSCAPTPFVLGERRHFVN